MDPQKRHYARCFCKIENRQVCSSKAGRRKFLINNVPIGDQLFSWSISSLRSLPEHLVSWLFPLSLSLYLSLSLSLSLYLSIYLCIYLSVYLSISS